MVERSTDSVFWNRVMEANTTHAAGNVHAGMDLVTREGLQQLTGVRRTPCISVFLPTHRAGVAANHCPLCLKSLIRDVEDHLRDQSLPASEIRFLLEPVEGLTEDHDFWQHQRDGLALFRSHGLFRYYRLPLSLPELAIVGDAFYLKPVLPLLTADSHFYVVALSWSRARVLVATRDDIDELGSAAMPARLEAVLREDVPWQSRRDDGGKELLDYYQRMNRGLRDLLLRGPAPVVLAGTQSLCPVYRQANTNPELLPEPVSANPDELDPAELRKKAARIAAGRFRADRRRAADQYLQLWHTQRASNILADILPAACEGRVHILFVAAGVQILGHFNAATNETILACSPAQEDRDLMSLAAVWTVATGGRVYAVTPDDVPGRGLVAAVFRY